MIERGVMVCYNLCYKKENKEYVKKLLYEYKLGDFLNAYPKELSETALV